MDRDRSVQMVNGYVIALIVFLAWIGLIYVLKRTKWLDRHNMSLQGPMLLWRTKRGRDVIDRLAKRRRFFSWYARAALWICLIAMIAIVTLLVWEATIVPKIKQAPSPELILGIPGVNPIIPIGYGILGLLVAIVVHEFAHGVLTRVGNIKVQALGLVFLVFPIGAFVEPDEKELQQTTRSRRSKVYAVGPATNIVVALIMLSIFSGVFMASADTVHDGGLTLGVIDGSPAARSGITANCVVTSIGGVTYTNASSIEDRASPDPGANVTVSYYFKGVQKTITMTDGLVVSYTANGFAASEAGLKTGMVLRSLNGDPVTNLNVLRNILAGLHAGDKVLISAMSYDSSASRFLVNSSITMITLSDKYDYFAAYDPSHNDPAFRGVAYMGAGFADLGLDLVDANYYQHLLMNPFFGDRTFGDYSTSALRLIALPFLNLAPLRSPVTDIYQPADALGWMPASVFWVLANSLYWIFWLNLMVGLTNVLPAVPLDGGYLFRDFMDYVLAKTGRTYTKEQREKVVSTVVLAFALLILALILWQLVGPTLHL